MSTAFFSHPDCRTHDMGPGHPECPQRLDAIADHLLATGLDIALEHHEPPLATLEQLQRAHSVHYVMELKDLLGRLAEEGATKALDPDTIANFCFFNNVAVAARHALDVRGLERVAIVDFDVHHGNGTEDIVAGDERVLMASFFQHPLYPGMVNVPIPPYTRGGEVREIIEMMWFPRLEAFRPQMLFISAGFDAHREDELGQLGLTEADYEWITRRLKMLADHHANGRIVSCLEGGYSLSALARSVAAHLRVLADVAA